MRGNITHISMVPYKIRRSQPLWQWDYGQILILDGLELPYAYEVHFACDETGNSVTQIGGENGVVIPDSLLQIGEPIHVWLYVHTGLTDGETEVHGILPVIKRARPTNATPTPVQQDSITETIAALNAAVALAQSIAEGIPGTINDALAAAKASGEFDGKDGKDGQDGAPGADGQDGYSPTIAVSDIIGGHRLTITDANGTRTVDVADGFSPTITVTDITGGHRLTITTASGTQTVDVMNGSDGDPTTIIDDSSTAQNKVWSADKTNQLLSAINVLEPTASSSDVDKFLKAKTVADGKVTEYEFGEASGGGGVSDVQVNGTSVVSDGVANVPVASARVLGAVKIGTGIIIGTDGAILPDVASTSNIKNPTGTLWRKPIGAGETHSTAFYGLAKAAGDSTQSASSNAVGTYTETAKSAIHDMLDAPETVSGSTPSITAKPGVRYICGEVSTLTIVVPASGIIDVVFESGSTATVLTVTPPTGVTMKWANGFDPTSLEANTVYEVNIMDGCYGVVGTWT